MGEAVEPPIRHPTPPIGIPGGAGWVVGEEVVGGDPKIMGVTISRSSSFPAQFHHAEAIMLH